MTKQRRILISPLDWGLGHASRVIPIIDRLLEQGDKVIIAGGGLSLLLLQKQFPTLESIKMPSFKMKYSAGKSQVWAVAKAFPRLIYYSIREHNALKRIVKEENIDFVISDNRFGLYHKSVPSAYITHQLLIKLPKGWTWLEPFVASVHRYIINKFTECWVPDYEEVEHSLAGELSHPAKLPKNVKYIGVLSRFNLSERSVGTHGSCVRNQILAILSGAEPQRTIFENELLTSLQNNPSENIILIKGKIEAEQKITKVGKVTVYNYMNTEQLQEHILKADKIICRSGYSSIMDLYALGKLKNATLIPTPGQSEQEYLAEYISNHIK